jgi:apolipoprotein N-acyltransferase
VSGALLSLALPPAELGPLAFVAAAPFIWLLRSVRPRRGALLGYVFGVAYVGAVSWWIFQTVGLVGWAPVSLTYTLAYAGFGFMVPALWHDERPLRSAAAVAAWWVVMEWIRGFLPAGGYTWGTLGTTQHDNPLLLPLASVTGVWGISFVVAFANASIVAAFGTGERRRKILALGLAALMALAPALIPVLEPDVARPLDVAIVQGNAPERHLFDRFYEDQVVAQNHARLHLTLASDPPDLAIWPENSIDRDPRTNPDLNELIESSVGKVGELGVPTLIGAITDAPDGRFYNENDYYQPGKGVITRYRKQKPVPYGEYVPFRERLGFIKELALIPRDMAPGEGPVLFGPDPTAKMPTDLPPRLLFTSVICFENSFGDLTRQAVNERYFGVAPGFLVVSTNNATFGRTALSRQHVALSQVRAAENGRWIAHAALSGISAFISPRGEVVVTTELFEPAILRREVPQIHARTIYTRLGDWFPFVCGLGVALAFLFAPARRRRREPPGRLDLRRALVVLPTYEERDTIEQVVTRVLAADPRVEILVVDDGSPDGTGEIVRRLGEGEPRVRLLERIGKRGLAGAYREGFRVGLEQGFDVIVEMDADLSHQPEELPRLLEATADHHVVIGSRYVPGGAVTNWGRGRVILSKGGNLYARTLLRLPVRDATSGYRAYRRDALADLLADGITSEGYGFQVELAYRAWRRGYSVLEVPITFREREHGVSKISRGIIVEAMLKVARWAWRDRFRQAV